MALSARYLCVYGKGRAEKPDTRAEPPVRLLRYDTNPTQPPPALRVVSLARRALRELPFPLAEAPRVTVNISNERCVLFLRVRPRFRLPMGRYGNPGFTRVPPLIRRKVQILNYEKVAGILPYQVGERLARECFLCGPLKGLQDAPGDFNPKCAHTVCYFRR